MVVLPNGQAFDAVVYASPFDGVGSDGAVVYNPNFLPTAGTAHVFIYTGASPEPYGSFEIAIPASRVPLGDRPICVLSAAWTNPDYAFGYAVPAWPWHSLQQGAYNTTLGTVSFRWDAVLQPNSSYSIHIYCGQK